jgi:bifunctional UDP-N-acetylglucosamine pyrophosphorylase / glucosamine-1-phosphate N-acetyltransferase
MRAPGVIGRTAETLMSNRSCLAIVLAAGEGTRMRAARPKVLNAIGSRTLLAHVLDAVAAAGVTRIAVVVGPGQEAVAEEARRVAPAAECFVQTERRGTADAVRAARAAIAHGADDVLIVYGDTPLVRPLTFGRLRAPLENGAAVTVLGFRPDDPASYGRLVIESGNLIAIREEADASDAERAIGLCNGGLMGLAGDKALAILDSIDSNNRKHEFYLTDAVAIAHRMALKAVAIETEEDDVRGVNTMAQLAEAEAVLQQRLRKQALDDGVTLVAPETVFLAADTKLGRDVVIEPHVVFGPGCVVEDEAVIHSFCHLTGAHIGRGASVGPFARLRPGARLGADVEIGNFVELKEASFADGAKAKHLSYIGDATVGENANVGAGTITCNYDGVGKHRTEIGTGAFIGSNSSLVAPVKVGEGAYVGAGSVISGEVPADALALTRAERVIKQGWATRLRKLKPAGKKR